MPIYEYKCEACGQVVEYRQRISDAPKTTCEACGGKLTKLISAAGFILKGGGWYKDLYASPKPQSTAGSSGGGDSASKSSTSDSKPASEKSTGSSAAKESTKKASTSKGD